MTKNKATFHKQFYSSKAVFGYKVHRHRCPGPRLGATMLLPDLLSRHRRTIPPPHSSSLFLPEPHTEMRRRDRRWDSEIRPVRCSTSSFRTWSYHRIPSSCLRHFWWKASRVLTSADCKVQCLRRIVTQMRQESGIYGAWCRVSGACRSKAPTES